MDKKEISDYLEFTEDKIAYINSTVDLLKNKEQITPAIINTLLAHYYGISVWILQNYELTVIEEKALQQEYKIWWSKCLDDARKTLNVDRIKSKFSSGSEQESMAIIANEDLYRNWQNKLIIAERKTSLYKRLQENWKDLLSVAITLASNSRAEMKALNIDHINKKNVKMPYKEG